MPYATQWFNPPLNPELDRYRKHHVLFLLIHVQGHGRLKSFGSVRPVSLFTLFNFEVSVFFQCRACLDILPINLATVKTIMRIQSSSIIKIVAVWLQTLRLWRVFKMPLLISRNVASLSIVNVVLIVQTVYIVFQNLRSFHCYCGQSGLKNVADILNTVTTNNSW